jgi:hypothetical protein
MVTDEPSLAPLNNIRASFSRISTANPRVVFIRVPLQVTLMGRNRFLLDLLLNHCKYLLSYFFYCKNTIFLGDLFTDFSLRSGTF